MKRLIPNVFLILAIAMTSMAMAKTDRSTDDNAKPKKIVVNTDSKVLVLELRSALDRVVQRQFKNGFKMVEEDDSFVAVVIDMDTPGGRVDVLQEIVNLCEACRVPVILYVEDMAISAGALISFAADEIYMKKGSVFGAAPPIIPSTSGVNDMPKAYREKLVSFIHSTVREPARKHGYREEIAKAIVDDAVEIRIGGELISPPGKLLTLNAQEAVKTMPDGKPLHAHGIVPSLKEVLEIKGLNNVAKHNLMTWNSKDPDTWTQIKPPPVEDALKSFTKAAPKVLTVTLSGKLNKTKVQKLKDAFDFGKSKEVEAAVVVIDSAGGDLASAQELAAQIEAFDKPVTVYVRKDALDAAVIPCFAADDVVVNDDAKIGGKKGIGDASKDDAKKVLSVVSSALKATADRNGHNADVAVAMIDPDAVFRADGKLLAGKGKLLLLTASDATRKTNDGKPVLAKLKVGSLDDLYKEKGWKDAEFIHAPFNGSDDFRTIKDIEDNLAPPIAEKIEVSPDSKVLILELKDDFNQLLLYHFRRGFKLVEEDKSYVAVIIDMNTPGGRVDVLKEIAAFCNACRVPVILYVEDMAISAGAILSFATDEIYMKDGSHIGAAAPVLIGSGGVQEVPESYKEKLMSFIRSSARALAQKNGYREEIAEAMIDAEVEVKIGDIMISPSGKLLTLTAREAVKIMPDGKPLHAHGIVATLDDVLKLKGLDKVAKNNVITLKTTASEKIAKLITMISPLLFILGIICFYVEARTPGFGVFGITALISFGLIFFGHHIAQAAGFEGVLIFLLGVILLLLELFVIPGFGIAGISGILCMLTGFVWVMIPYLPGKTAEFDSPWEDFGMDDLNVALLRMCASIVIGGFAFWLLAKLFPKTPIFNKLVHVGAFTSDAGYDGTDEKKNKSLEGKTGVAKSVLRPSGIATIDGKRVDVVTQGAFIEAGTKIRVKAVQGVRIVVVPVKDVEPPEEEESGRE